MMYRGAQLRYMLRWWVLAAWRAIWILPAMICLAATCFFVWLGWGRNKAKRLWRER